MAPQVYNGMVLVGNAGAEWPTRGFVEALDAKTGKLVWRFNTTAAPDEPGGKTWSGDSWKYGGGSVWNTPAIDPKNDLIAVRHRQSQSRLWMATTARATMPIPTPSSPSMSSTGKLRWWYQQVPHDVWDYDACAPVMLFDAMDENGKIVPAAAEAGKVGNLFIVNRLTGKLIRKSDALCEADRQHVHEPPATSPSPSLSRHQRRRLWSPPAYSPLTQIFLHHGRQRGLYRDQPSAARDYVPGTPTVGQ